MSKNEFDNYEEEDEANDYYNNHPNEEEEEEEEEEVQNVSLSRRKGAKDRLKTKLSKSTTNIMISLTI